MKSVTIQIDETQIAKIMNHFEGYEQEAKGDYLLYRAENEDCAVTIYTSKKGFKAVFTGDKCLEVASLFSDQATLNTPKTTINSSWQDLNNQFGSDEVGVGDFFGPMIVVACYVSKDDISWLQELGVDDSKKLKDHKIIEIVPQLLKRIPHSKLCLDNVTYNQQIALGINMNELKSKLHNRALYNVIHRQKVDFYHVYVDQFVSEKHYYEYIKNETKRIDNIIFKTKGENYFPSVAVASLIARYSFLKAMEVMSEKYALEFPKGASFSVDQFADAFVQKYGKDELAKVAKLNFVNYKKFLS